MQNRYVGDSGDFGKYGLLRDLGADLRLGVVWYLTPDESHNKDGKHITYLKSSPAKPCVYRDCDPDLFSYLAEIVHSGQRTVRSVRQRGVLPDGTCYFEDALSFEGMPSIGPRARSARLDHRARWLERAMLATRDVDMVFLDPDNGIESATQRQTRKGPKYVYFDEIQPYLSREQSVVVYHHLDRSMPAEAQISFRLAQLGNRLSGYSRITALRYRRGSARVFFVIATPPLESVLKERSHRFVQGPWAQNFELVQYTKSG